MTTPNTSVAIVDALGAPKNVPGFTMPGGSVAAGYASLDPVTGEAANVESDGFEHGSLFTVIGSANYAASTLNSISNTALAANAVQTGQWEALPKHAAISLNIHTTGVILVQIQQSQSAGGVRPLRPIVFSVTDSLNTVLALNGNFILVSVTNVSGANVAYTLDAQYTSSVLPTSDDGYVSVAMDGLLEMNRDARADALCVSRNSTTPGTAIALTSAAAAAFSATSGAIHIRNNNAAAGANIALAQLQLITAAAGTGLTNLNMLVVLDRTPRYSSGGTAFASPQSLRSARSPSVDIRGAATLSAAVASTIQVSRNLLRTGIPVIGDVFRVNFGKSGDDSGASSGAAATMIVQSAPSVVIPPQWNATIHLWGAGMTAAPTFEAQLSFIERG